jgi:hypothetical protein
LGVVATAVGDDASSGQCVVELHDGVTGTSGLKRAYALKMFALEEQLCVKPTVEVGRRYHRRAVDVWPDAFCGRCDVVDGYAHTFTKSKWA